MTTTQNLIEKKQIGNYVFSIFERGDTARFPNCPFSVMYERLTPKSNSSKSKVLSHYVFKSLLDAQKWIAEKYANLSANIEAHEARKLKQRQENAMVKASEHFKVGDIIVNTWGWEQTNVGFFQVVKIGNKTVEIAEIGQNIVAGSYQSGGMACNVVAEKDIFIKGGKHYTLRVKAGGRLSNPKSYYYMHKWDGRPEYKSWYA